MARRAHKLSHNRGRERLSSVARPRHPGAGGRRLEPSRLAPHEHDGMNDRGRDLKRDLKVDIHDLDRLSRSELRALWTQELGERPPATLGRDVLALGIAYTRQERRHGGLSRRGSLTRCFAAIQPRRLPPNPPHSRAAERFWCENGKVQPTTSPSRKMAFCGTAAPITAFPASPVPSPARTGTDRAFLACAR